MTSGANFSPAAIAPTVGAGLANSLLEYAVSRGADEAVLRDCAGIAPGLLDDADNRVAFANYVALMRAAKDVLGADFPLRFAQASDMAEFSVVGLLANASETMMDSFAQLNRYGRLVVEVDVGGEGRFRMESRENGMWLVDLRPDPNDFYELTETTFTRMITGPRKFLPRPHVFEAHVTHAAPAHRAVYDEMWACPITFSAPSNALRMDMSLANHRVRQESKYAFGPLSVHAEQLLKDLEDSKTARGRVESLLMPILHTGDVSMDTIAAKLALSRQTLYRNLKAEGVTFEQVLDELRHKLALHYLSGKKVSVNETAYLVGFSDPAAFSRAFKRWTGMSPRAARGA
ncbi:MAG: AraC family transcriptional regulator ligand-binding domain-containing protein [Hyphomonadaceae bacterium]